MTEVYVDIAAASMEQGTQNASAPRAAEPDAVRALRYLAESGIRVVLVANGISEPPRQLVDVAAQVVASMPSNPHGPAWYLTSDIERCHGSSARLRTVLIGAPPPSSSITRCDSVARDVHAAAMEILAEVAMPPRTKASRA